MTTPHLPRQLIICCDGTSNNLTGGIQDTNVVKLTRLIDGDRNNQLLYYDPGVGNPGELPGATWTGTLTRHAERIAGLAFGGGVYENIQEAYQFLMHHYQDGDQIYVFGFSRGAFTARSIAGLVNQFGILRPHMDSMLPTLLHVYFADRNEDREKYQRITKQIRDSFCNHLVRKVPIWFVGVWDTVASVGAWPFAARMTAIPTIKDKNFKHVRQALALDEQRGPFLPRPYVDTNEFMGDGTQSVKQLWFRGSHCDTGGGYKVDESIISDYSLIWLAAEAATLGLRFELAGKSLTNEDEIREALAPELQGTSSTALIHSQTYDNCLWAVTGLSVRDTSAVKVDDAKDVAAFPVNHESVSQHQSTFPEGTVWAKPRSKKRLVIAVLLLLGIFLCIGELHAGHIARGNSIMDLLALPNAFSSYLQANIDFANWQLWWWTNTGSLNTHGASHSPKWALTLDFLFIATYAYILAWFVVNAFASIAGLNSAKRPVSRILNMFGYGLPTLVVADIVKNIFSFGVTGFSSVMDPWLLGALGLAMSVCAAIKYLALLGVLGLIGWGIRV